jgi:hypothetical protein
MISRVLLIGGVALGAIVITALGVFCYIMYKFRTFMRENNRVMEERMKTDKSIVKFELTKDEFFDVLAGRAVKIPGSDQPLILDKDGRLQSLSSKPAPEELSQRLERWKQESAQSSTK